MNQDEQIKDWLFRYGTIFKKRYTRKQKDRFLDSLVADLRQTQSDIELYTFNQHEKDKETYRNVYVGNLQKAETVVCTYYDTPIALHGSYPFFNRKKQQRKTTISIAVTSMVWVIVGLLFTIYIGMPVFQNNPFLSFRTLLIVLVYGLYFYLFNKFSQGLAEKDNLIRNTSSILMLLDKITYSNAPNTAYAFLDAGCKNKVGLKKLLEQTDAEVVMLDSIGSSYPLYQVAHSSELFHSFDQMESIHKPNFRNEKLLYIISGKKNEDSFVLPREALKSTQLNDDNMNTVMNFLDEI